MTTEATPAPAATPTPAVPAAAAPPPAAPADQNPPWLAERLARTAEAERTKVLADLGIDDPKKAKAAIEAAAKAEEANKTAADKAAEAALEAKRATGEADKLRKIAADHAGRMMMALKPEHQAAVKELAGDDPAEQLKAIGILGPTWAAAGQVQPLSTPAVAPPANTAPPPNAPPAAAPGSPPDHKQVYASLVERDPFEAAAYGLQHPTEVFDIKNQ